MAEQEPVNFTWADTLPITVEGSPYELDLDMTAAAHARIFRWWQQLPDLEEQLAEKQAIDYLEGRIKGASRETIAGWKPMIRKQILAFLSNGTPAPTSAPMVPTSTTS